ncbi:MAG: LysM peptidoglycan-binding domain-containing protein [Firmicutes bacterium]|nr:LysM peptidoglycan-binding domain-containing protein [Bacillota bacterium]
MNHKVYDRINTISAICLLIVLVAGSVAVVGKIVVTKTTDFFVDYTYAEVVVQPGDTLWSIAKAQVPHEDPRVVVGALRDLNELKSADIFPGQVLTVLVRENVQPLQLAKGNTAH